MAMEIQVKCLAYNESNKTPISHRHIFSIPNHQMIQQFDINKL